VKTLNRGDVQATPLPDTQTVPGLIGGRIEDYNENHPHALLKMRSFREFIAAQAATARVSGKTGTRSMPQHIEEFFSSVQIVPEKLDELRRMPKARKQLAIYFTPRSGSSWLTEVLSQSNRLGRANEVFNPGFIPNIAQACNATSLTDYIDLVQRRLNTRGVFSFEITWHQLNAVFENADAFMEDFGAAKPAWLIRCDIVAQAVSLAKMVTTKVAHSISTDTEGRQQADSGFAYDPALIRRWLTHILVAERYTEEHFAKHGLKPLRLTYEGMMASGGDQTLELFAQYMNIPDIRKLPVTPRHSKLATSQNVDYALRFRQDEGVFMRDVEEERAAWLAGSHSNLTA